MNASPELFVDIPSKRKVRICYQTFGDPADSAVILIAGHAGSMLDWSDKLIPLFSPEVSRHFIIRYDHRDTGLSTEFPVPGGYTILDMADDVEGLANHLGLNEKGFHVVGASMGGGIATLVAARRPQQVRSLTLLYTSPGPSEQLPVKDVLNLGLQPTIAGFGDGRDTHIRNGIILYNGLTTKEPSPEERQRFEAGIARVVDRDMRGGTLYSKHANHGAASFGHWPGIKPLNEIKCPATVIQAANDQIFGVEHGETLAREIEKAEYVLFEDVGHELPWRVWKPLAETFLKTWKRGDDEWAEGAESKE
ncbi:uncharacterized protein NECHADRAFT_105719 [Fusarium vanettenii 77-13-4]|uniref:AB hydrolase-1 domain-containing protein n=1 Tax=Fusarium vanettenii (strain ATCC MYA-4622 / CBS 123669 / FGSC 9596 / NRRL 45880 / 77-13-4) TaxID=660122 RepID=C7ZDX8_FUSV7|nr:uncharacterized protein NECHADRAFT_105719 [Fusarium vanettenii 77-13-4]EEU37768.1 hypothetical protein NECHADRAFT_105719 [Fusarium vanettenii 77-13-4]